MTSDELSMLDDALNAEHGLSPREIDFIEDLENNWRARELSTKQESWLSDIATRAVERTP